MEGGLHSTRSVQVPGAKAGGILSRGKNAQRWQEAGRIRCSSVRFVTGCYARLWLATPAHAMHAHARSCQVHLLRWQRTHLYCARDSAQHVRHVVLPELRQLHLQAPKHEAAPQPHLLAHAGRQRLRRRRKGSMVGG